MTGFEVHNAQAKHVMELANSPLNPLDVAEWEGGAGEPVKPAFTIACLGPDNLFLRALTYEGKTVAVWGVSDTGVDDLGCLWLLGADFTSEPGEREVFFHTVRAREVELLHTGSNRKNLMALADDRNVQHHAWLRTMGFKPLPEKELGGDNKTVFTTYVRRQT